jgi:hypothetical protein
MATGMEMLFKSMGINPQQIMQQAAGIGEAFKAIQESMLVVHRRLDRIESNQLRIMAHLGVPEPMTPELLAIVDAGVYAITTNDPLAVNGEAV